MRALGLCLLAGTCAVSVILATPTPATSQPSDLSLGLGQFGAAAVEEVRHRPYRDAHRPYYRPYHHPYYGDDGWPYYYRPGYYDPGWSEASMQLNSCCNASLPNPSCLAGERRLAVDDDLASQARVLGANVPRYPERAPKKWKPPGF